MHLLENFARPCAVMEKICQPDGAGGQSTTWTEGEAFTCFLALDTSMEARRAEREGVTSLYSALVDRTVSIQYNDAFRDKLTGQTYRVTSKPEERKAPKSSALNLKYFTAERWDLTE